MQDVRNKNLSEKQLSSIYEDVSSAKSTINKVINILCVIGLVGLVLAILAGIFLGIEVNPSLFNNFILTF